MIDDDDQAAFGQRPGQPLSGRGVLPSVGAGREDVPERAAQAEQGGVLGVGQAGLGGQQPRGVQPGGRVAATAQEVRAGLGAQWFGAQWFGAQCAHERLDEGQRAVSGVSHHAMVMP